jgi:hypothetical protein
MLCCKHCDVDLRGNPGIQPVLVGSEAVLNASGSGMPVNYRSVPSAPRLRDCKHVKRIRARAALPRSMRVARRARQPGICERRSHVVPRATKPFSSREKYNSSIPTIATGSILKRFHPPSMVCYGEASLMRASAGWSPDTCLFTLKTKLVNDPVHQTKIRTCNREIGLHSNLVSSLEEMKGERNGRHRFHLGKCGSKSIQNIVLHFHKNPNSTFLPSPSSTYAGQISFLPTSTIRFSAMV